MRVGRGGEHGSSNYRITLITDPRIRSGGALGSGGSAERLRMYSRVRRQPPSFRVSARLRSLS